MKKKYIKFWQYSDGSPRCVYCGKTESLNPEDGVEWWFGIDTDGDRICDKCAYPLEPREVEGQWRDLHASSMARKRWSKTEPEERKKIMSEIAKRPRPNAKGKKKPRKQSK